VRNRFTIITALAAAAALALAGCSGSGDSDTSGAKDGGQPFRVVAFTSGNQTPIGAWWVKAMKAKAQELGWDLTMIQGDFDFQKMNPAVESAIGQGADVVIDGYTDVASIGSIVTAAKDADIPIFAIDSGVEPTDAFVVNITTNQQGIVDQTLGAIEKEIGSLSGKTVMVIGHDPHPGIRKRASLAEEALKKAGATIAGGAVQKMASPATARTEALKVVADYLSAHPNGLDAVWVGWDDAALGAVQAISEAGSKAKVTGSDAIAEALAAIQAGGPMLATSMQPWPEALSQLIDDVQAYQKDGTLPAKAKNFIELDPVLVDASNAAKVTPSDKLG
jgi:ribose transport system substrate-binding protein